MPSQEDFAASVEEKPALPRFVLDVAQDSPQLTEGCTRWV